MLNVIKIELKRAIINKKFVIVILLGCIMAVLAFVDTPGFTIAINWYKYMHNDEMASMIINKMNEVDTPLKYGCQDMAHQVHFIMYGLQYYRYWRLFHMLRNI